MKRKLLISLPAMLIALAGAAIAWADPQGVGHDATDDVIDTPKEIHREHETKQHGGIEGHLPGPSSENVELVGQLTFRDAAAGRIADVAALKGFAYLGAYWEPDCRKGGVYVVDISDPANPRETTFIQTANNTYVSEGVQALSFSTSSFSGDLLVHNNEACGNEVGSIGGISLVDVSDPKRPRVLASGVGDFTNADGSVASRAHQVHSAFAWQVGDKAYVVMVDDEEALDVDIMDITDPTNPVLIKETGLPDWPAAQEPLARGDLTFFHDVVVKQIRGDWIMLLSYWDAGWITLNVNDPANPVFLSDSDYADPDTLTGFSPAEGNAHQAEWSADNRFIIGTDEDFDAYRVDATITSGPFAGETFVSTQGSDTPQVGPGNPLSGATVFVGQACSSLPTAPANTIAVIERGTCAFTVKAGNVEAAGYIGGIVFNSQDGDPPCDNLVSMLVEAGIPMLFVARSTGFKILGTFEPATYTCPGTAVPAEGTAGHSIDMTAQFDGWGYVRLLNAANMREIDAYSVPEALDEAFASDFGDLSVHEVATDPDTNLAYLSYYAAGFRVVRFGPTGLEEVGHFIAADGNNFWGVEVYRTANGEKLILASDRDSGLWIFRYTGP